MDHAEVKQPWIAIQYNPRSGAGEQSRLLQALVDRLSQHGLPSCVFADRNEARAACADPHQRTGLRGIVAAGGDGTLLDVTTHIPGIPVAILPLGTENLVARYLGIPRNGTFVADMIAAGHRRRLDVACLGDQRFTVMASVGFDADVIHRAHARRTGHITRAQYVGPIWATVWNHRYPELQVYLDQAADPIMGHIVVVANLPVYALGLQVAPTARGDDGLLDVRVFQRGSTWNTLRYFGLLQWGWHEHAPDVIQRRSTRVRITSDEPVPVQTDGDPAGWTPIDIRIEPGYAEFFVPQRFAELHK